MSILRLEDKLDMIQLGVELRFSHSLPLGPVPFSFDVHVLEPTLKWTHGRVQCEV